MYFTSSPADDFDVVGVVARVVLRRRQERRGVLLGLGQVLHDGVVQVHAVIKVNCCHILCKLSNHMVTRLG